MNALEERMLALLAEKMRKRPEIVADLDSIVKHIKAPRQTQEAWIQIAEKASQPADAPRQQGDGA